MIEDITGCVLLFVLLGSLVVFIWLKILNRRQRSAKKEKPESFVL